MKYKEFTEGTFYEKLKQCIKEGYDVPTWKETQGDEMQSKFQGRLVYLRSGGFGLSGYYLIIDIGRFVGVKRQSRTKRKEE